MPRPSPRRRPPAHPAGARLALPLLAAVLLLPALADRATADRLVLRDGAVVETEGAWRVEGRLVVFQRPGGQLASLRLADVDLDASTAATEEARAAATAPPAAETAPPPRKRSALVLTDADVRHVPDSAEPITEGDSEGLPGPQTTDAGPEGAAEAEKPPSPPNRLQVTRWEQVSDPDVDGIVIAGEVPNRTRDLAANLSVTVLLYDAEGELIATNPAELTATTLQPGQTARFRAEILGVFSFSAVKFEVERLALSKSGGEDSEGPTPEGGEV